MEDISVHILNAFNAWNIGFHMQSRAYRDV
jgi:hypothetical protein